MADTVQYHMENMIPELKDYSKREIFSPVEINAIMKRRRGFEYGLKRRPSRKVDGLRYIEYELNLNKLLKQRLLKLGVKKLSTYDYAIVKRVHLIFDRVLLKFHGDLSLWCQYIELCKHWQSNRILSKVFSRCLQFHPKEEGIWIEAANWEFQTNGNVLFARTLLQRAIRINPSNERLWHEYFRLEFLFVSKLRKRREILGLTNTTTAVSDKTDTEATSPQEDDNHNNTDEEEEVMMMLPKETSCENEENSTSVLVISEQDASKEKILTGAIPLLVYTQAIKAIPANLDFRIIFLEIAHGFPVSYSQATQEAVLTSLAVDFSKNATACALVATQFIHSFPFETRETPLELEIFHDCLHRFRAAMTTLDIDNNTSSDALRFEMLSWLERALHAHTPMASSTLEKLVAEWKLAGCFTNGLYLKWINVLEATESCDVALQVATDSLAAIVNEVSPDVYVHVAALMHRTLPNGSEAAITFLTKATTTLPACHHFVLYEKIIALQRASTPAIALSLILTSFENADRLIALFDPTCRTATATATLFRCTYVSFCHQHVGHAMARQLVDRFLTTVSLLPTPETLDLLQTCLAVEGSESSNVVSAAEALTHATRTRQLFERLVDLFPTDERIWRQYMTYYQASHQFKQAHHIRWRAEKVLPSDCELLVTA